ncbi:tryptophan 2,3-dioxygenase family protein [Sanyastnella coralliicola]|uniref:tryptophan 2,3-dioxygenase family protein n=1 Tax=Sanyastnella coralliicola TaxID=3069118 RepID=UPI0027BAE180|nr:tryptophan 2,3-dioxygenase family protein [Longitalea sp. SCSIO 12813]
MELNPDIIDKVKQLQAKYAAMGQDLESYLDGLLYADYLTYWEYIKLDTLLSLQSPITPFPDEEIFIMYHQITELYFKLTLHEFEQIASRENLDKEFLVARVQRINRYFEALTKSFDIMVDGMEREQFLKFRMSLLPASGFQSAQYRMIEIWSTSFDRLVAKDERHRYNADFKAEDIEQMYEHIYWKRGATELQSGEKTLTLKQFEIKYSKDLIELAERAHGNTLIDQVRRLPEADQQDPALIEGLKWLDTNVNVNWPLAHYKSAVRYLHRAPEDIAATGGTNWQKYLPPRFQKRIFFEEVWSAEELDNWGRGWVESVIVNLK